MSIKALSGVDAGNIVAIASEAGSRILKIRADANLHIRTKDDESPVTAADIAASDFICASLANLPVKLSVISEEHIPLAPPQGRYWLVDPLDGTKEFIDGSDEFTVNIALIENNEPVFGVVYIPVTGVAFWGGKSDLPEERKADGRKISLQCRRLPVQGVRCALSKSHRANEQSMLHHVFSDVGVTYAGSSIKYMSIAQGTVDFSFRRTPTSIWDTAASHAILRAAGGEILGPTGRPLVYDTSTLINPPFVAVGDPSADWSAMIQIIQQ